MPQAGINALAASFADPRQRLGRAVRALLPVLPAIREPPLPELPPRLRAWADEAAARVDRARLWALVSALPGPRSRLHAPAAMDATDALILEGLRAAGWPAERQPFTFTGARGYRDYGDYGPITYPRLEGANIVAVKRGRAPAAVAVIAHHDTVRDSPGADDNGAAVAALVELARLLAPVRLHRTVVLAATDMEELGFFGARALGVRLWRERSLHGLINLESVAYTAAAPDSQVVPPGLALLYPAQYRRVQARQRRGDFTALIYNGPAAGLAAAFAAGLAHLAGAHAPLLLRNPLDLPWVGRLLPVAVPAVLNFARSDHLPFWLAGVPAVLVTDTANFRNPHYHRPTDTPETLDVERLAAVTAAAAVAVAWTAGLA